MANIIYRGEDKVIPFNIKTSAGLIANLTGAVATFRLGLSFNALPLITQVCDIPAPLTGAVFVTLSEVQTAALAYGPHIYELEITQDGATTVAAQGTIDVLGSLVEAP